MTNLLKKAQEIRAELNLAIERNGGLIHETHNTGAIVDRLYAVEVQMQEEEPESHAEYCRMYG